MSMEHVAAGGSLASLLSTLGAFKWLHNRSVRQGEVSASNGARLDGHDQQIADMKSLIKETNDNVRMLVDHMMNGKK